MAFAELGWETIESGFDRVRARSPSSFWSWGEEVTVFAQPDVRGGANVIVESRPVAQMFDWGRSSENAERVERALRGGA